MRRAITAVAVLVATVALAAPASAAAPTPTERKLQTQINVLNKKVKKLQKQVAGAQNLAIGAIAFSVCNAVATADALQGTWTKIEAHEGTGTAIFGAQTPVTDPTNACSAFNVTRAQNQATTAVFQALLNIFR